MKDDLGDRQKAIEKRESGRRLLDLLPALARIDGRNFSKFTKGMDRPFDARMSLLMVETTKWLVAETCALCGYTQSDEITLAWYTSDRRIQIFFDGRIQKMVSQLAALATLYFNSRISSFFPDEMKLQEKFPTFDARVWNVPTLTEAANCFIWREWDASKNSISMAARHYFSHDELHNKNGKEMQEMLWLKYKINWNDYPNFFKRGTYVRKITRYLPFSVEDLESLPAEHHARKNPELKIEPIEIVDIELPRLASVQNREGVLFNGEDPIALGVENVTG